jgi:hypothetical protein
MLVSELRGSPFYVLTGLSIVLISLAYQVKAPFAIDVGAPGDAAFLENFHDAESSGELDYRWTSDSSSIIFPNIGGYAPALLRLRLNGHRPADLPHPTVAVRANGTDITSFPVTEGFETYELVLERRALGASGSLQVELHSEAFVPHEYTGSGDQRALGVLVDYASAQFEGGMGTVVIPAPLPMILVTAGVLVSYLLVRWFVPRPWALATASAILTALSWLLATKRMQIAPYLSWLLFVPGLALLVMVLARRTTKTRIGVPLYAAGVATILLGLWRFASVAELAWMGVAPDFANNVHTATVLRSGGMIYDVHAPLFTGYDNPPLTALLHLPFTLLSFQNALRLFFGMNTLLMATSVALIFITERAYLLTYPYWMIAVALVLNLDPVLDSLLLGQLDAVILLLIVVSFVAYRQGRDLISGSSLGLAAMIKFSPALLIGYFLLKKRLRVFASAVAAVFVIAVVSLVLAGLDVHVIFVRDVLPTLLSGSAQLDNQSLNGFFNRLFLEGEFITELLGAPPLPHARLLTLASSMLLLGTTIYLIRGKTKVRTHLRFDLEYSLVVISLPLISSIAWHHYMTWYVLPLAVLLNPKLRTGLGKRARPAMVILTGLSYLCLSVPMSLYAPACLEGVMKLLISVRLYAGLTLYSVFAYLLTRQSAGHRCEVSDLNAKSGIQ